MDGDSPAASPGALVGGREVVAAPIISETGRVMRADWFHHVLAARFRGLRWGTSSTCTVVRRVHKHADEIVQVKVAFISPQTLDRLGFGGNSPKTCP